MQNSRGAALAATERTGSGPRSWGIVVVLMVGLIAADQASKAWALRTLQPWTPRPAVGTLLQFNLVFNPGAAFSLGSGFTIVFPIIAILVAAGVLLYVVPRLRTLWWSVATGCLLAGIIGNLIDRIARPPAPFHGEVVDFLMLPYWPIFNVADICICVAAGIFVVLSLWGKVGFDGRPLEHGTSKKTATSEDTTADTAEPAAEDLADEDTP